VLTRRHIRVKVFQTLYAMSQTGSEDLGKADKFLEQSCQAYEDLHLAILAIFSELKNKEIDFQTIFKNSHIKTDDFEKKLNQKLIENQMAQTRRGQQGQMGWDDRTVGVFADRLMYDMLLLFLEISLHHHLCLGDADWPAFYRLA
jgi:hypothetical protein